MGNQESPNEGKQGLEGRFEKVDDLQELAAMQDEGEPSFTIAGRHKVLATLGQGGMGAVYRAHDSSVPLVHALGYEELPTCGRLWVNKP